jgi:chorismate mutase
MDIEKILKNIESRDHTCKNFVAKRIYNMSEVAEVFVKDNAKIYQMMLEGKLKPDFKSHKKFYFTRETIIALGKALNKVKEVI